MDDNSRTCKSYRADLDALKGISILAVIFYHMGILDSGYLGVDVFFVLNGFFILPGIADKISEGEFHYIRFLKKRIMRLLPVLLLACAACLAAGYFLMLPDDYENLSESVIASVFFSNNILSAVTTGNYWDTVNAYKPLMHTWYLGILAEFYVIIPPAVRAGYGIHFKKSQNKQGGYRAVFILSLVSFLIYLLPFLKAGSKFYFLPARFFELGLGGLAGGLMSAGHGSAPGGGGRIRRMIPHAAALLLFLTLFTGIFTFDPHSIGNMSVIIGKEFTPKGLLLPGTVLLPAAVLSAAALTVTRNPCLAEWKALQLIGKRSYSLFVWHQVLLAFLRYSFFPSFSVSFAACFAVLLVPLSEITYRAAERRNSDTWKLTAAAAVCAGIICAASGAVYIHSGIVRDVPELGIVKNRKERFRHSEYCDRIYSYDRDFEEDGRIKVLVVGNSFARDWGNVLLESRMSDRIDLSFCPLFNESAADRAAGAEYLFYFGARENIPDYVWDSIEPGKVFGIGTKNFGITNGYVYFKRNREDYFSQTVPLDPGYEKLNSEWSRVWGDQYINIIEMVRTDDGTVRVFTPDKMYISQDCKHLTHAGAVFLAGLVRWDRIFR